MATDKDGKIAPEQREEHKKKVRLHNSLGALLSGLGGSAQNGSGGSGQGGYEKDVSSTSEGNKDNFYSEQRRQRESSPESGGRFNRTGNERNVTGQGQDTYGGSSDANQREPDDYNNPSKRHKSEENVYSKDLESWGDAKKFDDDYDTEWVESEHKRLDELYGQGIITMKYNEQGTLEYYCELCYALMNAKKPLEMHCSGMKHLKKKDIYDKNKAAGDHPLGERRKMDHLPLESRSSRGRGDRGQHSRYPRGGPFDRERFMRDAGRDPYGRGGFAYGPPGERDPYRHERDYYGYDWDPYGRGRDRYEPYDRSDPSYNRHRMDEFLRGYPGYPDDRLRRDSEYSRYADDYWGPYASDRPRSSSDLPHLPGDRPRSSSDLPIHPDDRMPYTGDRPRPPDNRSPYPSDYPRRRPEDRSLYPSSYRDDRIRLGEDVPKVPTPPPAQPPAPIISAPALMTPPVERDISLSGGPAAILLSKLAECTVKNEGDADLANNVINLLLKSLKEYNFKVGEKSVAELMEQAEIKLGTAKAIRGVRPLAPPPKNPMDAISQAMETLRRANAEKPPEYHSQEHVWPSDVLPPLYRVAILGHSQVPHSFPSLQDVEVRIYRVPDARLEEFDKYEEFHEVFQWPHDLNIIFLGGNDINHLSADEITGRLLHLSWQLRNLNQHVSLVLIEPREYPSAVFNDIYRREADKVNRRLKRIRSRGKATYTILNFNADPFKTGHVSDGVHFDPHAVQHIIAKMRNIILYHKENQECYDSIQAELAQQ